MLADPGYSTDSLRTMEGCLEQVLMATEAALLLGAHRVCPGETFSPDWNSMALPNAPFFISLLVTSCVIMERESGGREHVFFTQVTANGNPFFPFII